MTARFIVGDVLDVLATLPEASVDLVLTSPPFLALRSYLPNDHPDKGKEIGSEPTPGDYLDALLDVTEACARVLAPHGSLVFELGDTYAGSGGAGGDYSGGGLREGQPTFRQGPRGVRQGHESRPGGHHFGGTGWPLAKSLTFIPQLFGASLAYGRNLLRPERLTDPWRVRNVVAWVRPNPPVGALADKYRAATSYLTVATKARARWFDLDAVRTPHSVPPESMRQRRRLNPYPGGGGDTTTPTTGPGNPSGAPPLDYWEIPSQPYKGAHYATWPEALLHIPIASMCPRQVCTTCGLPRTRIVASQRLMSGRVNPKWKQARSAITGGGPMSQNVTVTRDTVGWSDCGHDTWRPGIVLDPFAGTGTTVAVAVGHGRSAIGIDLDERNADLARERVGLWLEVETHREVAS